MQGQVAILPNNNQKGKQGKATLLEGKQTSVRFTLASHTTSGLPIFLVAPYSNIPNGKESPIGLKTHSIVILKTDSNCPMLSDLPFLFFYHGEGMTFS